MLHITPWVSGLMGWYVALLIKDCRYFCCSSNINLIKGKDFLVSFRRSEKVCEIGAFVFAGVILFRFLFKNLFLRWIWRFFQFFLEVLQLLFDLSVKSTHETEWSKVTQWNGTEQFLEKSNVFVTEWQMFFFTCWLLISEQVLWIDTTLIRLDGFV